MTVLNPRRFPDRIVRLRKLEGKYNSVGEWTPGPDSEEPMRASVQPIALADRDTEGGAGLTERIVVYVPQENALLAALEDNEADQVRWVGKTFTVIEFRSWPGGHTRATLLRES